MNQNRTRAGGYASAALAYFLWGILTLFWKLIPNVAAPRILAHRILWSTAVLIPLVLIYHRRDTLSLLRSPKKLGILALTGLLLSANWVTYIFAVNSGRILDASMGYYINPLVNVLLGFFFLKERLTKLQAAAVLLAASGVLLQLTQVGAFPWIALILAFSFGFYGLIRKSAEVQPMPGLFTETLFLAPLAAAVLFLVPSIANARPLTPFETVILVLSGPVTVIPLLLFNRGAREISLTALGFLQYIGPTLMFLIGRILYAESLTPIRLGGFLFIWAGLGLYLYSLTRNKERKPTKERLRQRD